MAYGYQYRLRYQSEAVGAVSFVGDQFQNTATVNGEEKPATATPVAYGGGGADAGDYTQFTIAKDLTNNTPATMPESFVLVASTAGEITIPANGDAVLSPYFLAANPVKLCETVPVVAGVTWAPYTITGTGVTGPDAAGCYTITGAGGANIELSVNNTANSSTGTFSVTKSVTGPADVVAMTDGTSYTVNGVAATTPLTVTVGQPVTSPALPVGATVVLTEVKPVVTGVVFGTPVFTPSTVTIGQGTNVAVTLENPATLKPVTSPPAKLPNTGVEALGLAAGAAALIAAGAAAVLIRRRRTQD